MKKNIALIILLIILVSCRSEKKQVAEKEVKTEIFKTKDFEIIKSIQPLSLQLV